MRSSVSHYVPIREVCSDEYIAMQRYRSAPVLIKVFSYQGLKPPKRRQLARNLYQLTEYKHPSLLTYITVINDRQRASYHLVSEACSIRPLTKELDLRTSMRIFSTTELIESFLCDLMGAVAYVFSRNMRHMAIKLLCHSLFVENIYVQADGHAKLALRPYYGKKGTNIDVENQPLDLYNGQSEETIVFLLGQIAFRVLLTANDFTEFTRGRAYLLSLHCRKRFGAQLVDLIEHMTRTVVQERVTLSTLLKKYCDTPAILSTEASRGISRTKDLGLTDLMVAAALNSYREIYLYLPFQQFCTDRLGRTALMIALETGSYTTAHYLLCESGYIYKEPGVDYGDLDYIPTAEELEEIAHTEAAEKEAAELAERLAAEKKTKGKKKKVSRPPTALEEEKPNSRTNSRSGTRGGTEKPSDISEKKTSKQLREELQAKKDARPLPYTGVRGSFSAMRMAAEHKYGLFRGAIHYERHLLLQEGFTELMIGVLAANYKIFQQFKHQTTKQDNRGYTACMYAVKAGCLPIVAKLIDTEKNIKNNNDETAGSLALQEGNQEIIDLLTRYESILDCDKNSLLHRSVLKNIPEDLAKYSHLMSQYNAQGKTALMLAAEHGYESCVKELLSEAKLTMQEDEPTLPGWKGVTALMLAALNGHTSCVKLLERDEAECRDTAGQHTALMAAALANQTHVIPFLINREGGLQNNKGCTALMLAVEKEHIESVDALLEVEAKYTDSFGNTALMRTVLTGNLTVAKHLMEHEAMVIRVDNAFALQLAIEQNKQDLARELMKYEGSILLSTGFTDLMKHAFFGELKECHQFLNQVKHRTNVGMTALMFAARAGHLEIVKLLFSHESGLFDSNAVTAGSYAYRSGHEHIYSLLATKEVVADENNHTLLHKAAETRSMELTKSYNNMVGRLNKQNKTACQLAKLAKCDEVVGYLEKKGDVVDVDQCTLLHLAAIKNSVEDAEKLLHMVGCYNKMGKTALMEAAERDNVEIVELLTPFEAHIRALKGFTIGGSSFSRPTALMLAARSGSAGACEKLLAFEATLVINETGLTALMAAALQDKVDCINILKLKEHGMTEKTGKTALMLAAKSGKVASVKALAELEHGAKDNDGKTAATLAKQAKRGDCVIALKAYEKPETKQSARTENKGEKECDNEKVESDVEVDEPV